MSAVRLSRRGLGALAALVLLAGCQGGVDAPSVQLQILETVEEGIRAKAAPPPPRPALTRATLDRLDGAFLEATREQTGQTAILGVNLTRRDGSPGRITVWRAEDAVTLATRNGVLIATRGLGGDVISTEVQVAGDSPGPARGGARVLHVQALDNQAVPVRLSCTLADLGPETLTIVERRHATRHLRETCSGDGGTVVNDYWTEGGLVRQSRQWAGPFIGYLKTRQLTE